MGDAQLHDLVGRHGRDVLSHKLDPTALGAHQAGDGADAAEHRRGKGLDARHGAGGGHQGRIGGAEQHSRDGGKTRADGEGDGDGGVHVDAHELGRALVLGAGAHGLAHLGPVDEEQQDHHNDEADADGRDEHGQRRGLPQGLVGQLLDDHAQYRAHQHGKQHAHDGRQIVLGRGEKADVSAHHDHVSVGEIQHFGDTVDHGIAQGDDGVDAAQADAADQIVQKTHGFLPRWKFSRCRCAAEKGPRTGPLSAGHPRFRDGCLRTHPGSCGVKGISRDQSRPT